MLLFRRLCARKMILRLEMLQPRKIIDSVVTFSAANGGCENPGLVPDDVVVKR